MKIETKFNIGDEVWFRRCNVIVKGIVDIIFIADVEGLRICYGLCDYDNALLEKELFRTKQELLDSL